MSPLVAILLFCSALYLGVIWFLIHEYRHPAPPPWVFLLDKENDEDE